MFFLSFHRCTFAFGKWKERGKNAENRLSERNFSKIPFFYFSLSCLCFLIIFEWDWQMESEWREQASYFLLLLIPCCCYTRFIITLHKRKWEREEHLMEITDFWASKCHLFFNYCIWTFYKLLLRCVCFGVCLYRLCLAIDCWNSFSTDLFYVKIYIFGLNIDLEHCFSTFTVTRHLKLRNFFFAKHHLMFLVRKQYI